MMSVNDTFFKWILTRLLSIKDNKIILAHRNMVPVGNEDNKIKRSFTWVHKRILTYYEILMVTTGNLLSVALYILNTSQLSWKFFISVFVSLCVLIFVIVFMLLLNSHVFIRYTKECILLKMVCIMLLIRVHCYLKNFDESLSIEFLLRTFW